jgi:hypothetical protein
VRDVAFHDALYSCCGNQTLLRLIEQLRRSLKRVYELKPTGSALRKKAIAEHRKLAQHCEQGDTRAAAAALLAHLDAAQAAMRKSRPPADAGKVTSSWQSLSRENSAAAVLRGDLRFRAYRARQRRLWKAADRMAELASEQPGYLGVDSVRDANGVGITVSYWTNGSDLRLASQCRAHDCARTGTPQLVSGIRVARGEDRARLRLQTLS